MIRLLITDEKDEANVYTGKVRNRVEGFSSAESFPKKAYSFETKGCSRERQRNNIYFGWPEESDYFIPPSYHEKVDAQCISYGIVQVHGFYASRTQFVEVLIDQNYMGVYEVMEKIKRSRAGRDCQSF